MARIATNSMLREIEASKQVSQLEFEVLADVIAFKKKPTGAQAGGIKKRLNNPKARMKLTLPRLAEAIRGGYTICPGVLEGGMGASNWVQQQVFMLDFDGTLDPLDALMRAEDASCFPDILYFTFANDERHFRFVWVTEKPVNTEAERVSIIDGLMQLFPECDTSCKNADRLFYGSNGEVFECYLMNSL